jgi:hypothetical protein
VGWHRPLARMRARRGTRRGTRGTWHDGACGTAREIFYYFYIFCKAIWGGPKSY